MKPLDWLRGKLGSVSEPEEVRTSPSKMESTFLDDVDSSWWVLEIFDPSMDALLTAECPPLLYGPLPDPVVAMQVLDLIIAGLLDQGGEVYTGRIRPIYIGSGVEYES